MEIVAEQEQEFLARLYQYLGRQLLVAGHKDGVNFKPRVRPGRDSCPKNQRCQCTKYNGQGFLCDFPFVYSSVLVLKPQIGR